MKIIRSIKSSRWPTFASLNWTDQRSSSTQHGQRVDEMKRWAKFDKVLSIHSQLIHTRTATAKLTGISIHVLLETRCPPTVWSALLSLSVVKAVGLHRYHWFKKKLPNCYARIVVDDRQPVLTKTIKGANPKWNKCFDMSLSFREIYSSTWRWLVLQPNQVVTY